MCVVSHIHQYFIPSNGYVASLVAQSVKNLPENRRPGFDSWVGKIPWRRKWQPTPVFLPGESHGQRSLAGYTAHGVARVRHDLVTKLLTAM